MTTEQNAPPTKPAGGPKPGAMTMAMRAVQVAPQAGPKVLRIGLIQGGKIVEERIIRNRETVSVGTSERNHFIVQSDQLPSRFELFQLVGNDYILNFADYMTGRVGLPGGVQTLEQLRKSGGARNAGSHWQVKLNDASRGKVTIGSTTILFQFVTPPPVQPRPQLPAAVRGGFIKGIDWLFTSFVVFSYMIFFGMIVYLESADWPIDQGIAAVPEDLERLIVEEPEPPPEEESTTEEPSEEEAAKEESPKSDSQANESKGESEDKNPSAGEVAEAAARIAEEASAQVETMLMGAIGEGGALADVLAGGADTTGAAEVLSQASGVGVASGGAGGLREAGGGGGSGRGGDLGSIRASGGGTKEVGTGTVIERVIRGNVNFEVGEDVGGSGDFDQSEVTKVIKGAQSALRRCYETELKTNPTVKGKVVIEFTIEPTGSVSKSRAVENTSGSGPLGSCVEGAIKRLRWRQGPEGGSVTFQYPFVFQPQN